MKLEDKKPKNKTQARSLNNHSEEIPENMKHLQIFQFFQTPLSNMMGDDSESSEKHLDSNEEN